MERIGTWSVSVRRGATGAATVTVRVVVVDDARPGWESKPTVTIDAGTIPAELHTRIAAALGMEE